eukprot:TRINITY_DN1880_c0_g1_i4.p1 TRINITY_DN1880_c0_g1~~TRINITY_DN1880_c0_g1_i4.p1  ORF type:complete len:703 (+),score=229.84 TRINITY_DN1880_c0_g1_i4:153-2261(+)
MALLDLAGLPGAASAAGGGRGDGGAVNMRAAKLKLNELYMCWLVLPETQDYIQRLSARRRRSDVNLQVDTAADGTRSPAAGPAAGARSGSPGATGHLHPGHGPCGALSPPRSPGHSPRSGAAAAARGVQGPCVDELDAAHRQGAISPRCSPRVSPEPFRSVSPTQGIQFAPVSPQAAVTVSAAFASLDTAQHSSQHASHRTPPRQRQHVAEDVAGRRGSALRQLSGEQRVAVPQFFHPKGKPVSRDEAEKYSLQLRKLWEIRKPGRTGMTVTRPTGAGAQAPRRNSLAQGAAAVTDTRSFTQKTCSELVSKGCLLPKWMSALVFRRILAWEPGEDVQRTWRQRAAALAVHPTNTVLHHQKFKDFFDAELGGKPPERRLFDIIKCDASREYIVKEDLRPLVEEVLQVHQGLEFLKQTPDFQERYADTVQIRVFFAANLKDDGQLSWGEWQRSTVSKVLYALDEENDINVSQKTEFFSYEHFYVLYCKFWELDSDHDSLISKDDLAKYGSYSLTNAIVDRIFAGCGRRRKPQVAGKMTYDEFVWFCLCEEDKSSQQSLEYWFRCIDMDGDGVLSGFELAHFFAEQKLRMEASYQETIAWADILCQMVDIIKPKDPKRICLQDIKGCPLSGNFFNALFNLNKFIAFEQRDPFAAHAERQLPEKTEWDRFAKVEYDRMSHEAGEEDAAMLEEYGAGGQRQWRADAG